MPFPSTPELGRAAPTPCEPAQGYLSFPCWLGAQVGRDDDIGRLARESSIDPNPTSAWWDILCAAIVEWAILP